jgi:hypothetical protein
MGYTPAGKHLLVVSKYEAPKPPAPQEPPWIFLIILFTLCMVGLTEFKVGFIVQEKCFGAVCVRVDTTSAAEL